MKSKSILIAIVAFVLTAASSAFSQDTAGKIQPVKITNKAPDNVAVEGHILVKSEIQKFEYLVVPNRDLPTLKTNLNQQGDQGWELVSVTFQSAQGGDMIAIFKRPKY